MVRCAKLSARQSQKNEPKALPRRREKLWPVHIGAHDLARNAGSRDGGQIYAMLFRDLTGQRRTSVLRFSGIFQYS